MGAALIIGALVAPNQHLCQPSSVVCFHWDLQSVVLLPYNSFAYHSNVPQVSYNMQERISVNQHL